MKPQRILIFAPCTNWIVHHQLDCVLGAALANRGCDVRVIGCDGLFDTCHVKGNPPNENACRDCQRYSREWFQRFKLSVTQLAALLTPEDRTEARAWADDVDMVRFPEATFHAWPIGKWTLWNLHSDLLTGQLDFSLPEVQERAREFAFHGALIALAVQRMLAEFKPDRAICYNGTMSYYRVFFELCQQAGVRTLTHERGFTDGSFVFFDNLTSYQHHLGAQQVWTERWRHVALDEARWRKVAGLFASREKGGGMNFQEIHRFRSDAALTREQLRLPVDAKILLVLASGDWESGMFKSYGGLGVLWETQIEWIEETARLCAARGWHLVVRHHPLGAGKKTYPRASAFLAGLIKHQGRWGQHVRVVMPAENLSTYDVMSIASAAVTQFTTSGAEALVRGLPVVCVAASAYRHMGMDWVRDRADYADALDRAMAKEPPLDEAALRDAFRYAFFHFYTMGSTHFSSVGIKNAYEPDFRLGSPAELQPGVDPQMDRLCEHLQSHAPLYPLPAAIATPDDENRLTREYREHLVKRRQAIRSNGAVASRPGVTVWLLGEALKRGQTEFPPPADWRCRHKEVMFDWMVLDARGGVDAMRLTLANTAAQAPTPYVFLHPANITLDESAISQAVDLLEKPENRDRTGVLFGCYVMEGADARVIGPEWNTATHPAEASQLPPPGIHSLTEPMTVLSIVLWRREKLAGWLAHSLPAHDNDDTWCHDMLASFLNPEKFVNLAEPVVFIRAGERRESIIARADALSQQGDLEAALKEAASCQERFGLAGGLRIKMASWLCRHSRPAQAAALIHAEYHNGTPGPECWDMLRETLPQLAVKRPGYKDCHSAVDTVSGYMVPGQERFLHEKILSLPRDARILEIGAFFGRSTAAMSFACVGTQRRIFTIDTFSGNDGLMGRTSWFYNHWRGNLRRLGLEPCVTACPGFSHRVVQALGPHEAFDFVFIDASHEYKDVLLDFELAWPHVRPGGWIGFHDVEPGWPGCWRVWQQTGKRLLTDHATCDTLACGRKIGDTPWNSFEDEWPGHTASVARHLAGSADRRELGQAMLALLRGELGADIESTIAAAPEAVRQQFINAIPEAGDDPWLHRVLAIMLAPADPVAAAQHEREAAHQGLCIPHP